MVSSAALPKFRKASFRVGRVSESQRVEKEVWGGGGARTVGMGRRAPKWPLTRLRKVLA